MIMKETVTVNFPFYGILSLIYGVLSVFCLYQNPASILSPVFCVLTIAYFSLCFWKLGKRLTKGQLLTASAILLLGISNMRTASDTLIFFNGCAIILLLGVFLLRFFQDLYHINLLKFLLFVPALLLSSPRELSIPFLSMRDFFKIHDKKEESKAKYIWLGILIALPLLLLATALLSSADAVFGNLFKELFHFLGKIFELPMNLFAIPFWCIFAVLGSICIFLRLHSIHMNLSDEKKKDKEVLTALIFLSPLTLLYLLFSIIQILYLFTGSLALPQGYTYASYAREGFFQLLIVCLLNLALVLLCSRHFREHRLLKILLCIICGCTFIMTVSSLVRILLYISAYGLTFLRLAVIASLIAIFCCLVGILISVFRDSFPLFVYILSVVSICYLVFSLARPDYVTASYNCSLADETMAFESIASQYLSLDAVPALAQKMPKALTSPEYALFSEDYITERKNQMTFRTFNFSIDEAYRSVFATNP